MGSGSDHILKTGSESDPILKTGFGSGSGFDQTTWIRIRIPASKVWMNTFAHGRFYRNDMRKHLQMYKGEQVCH